MQFVDFLALPCTISCETWETMTNYKINELLGAISFQKQYHKNPLKYFDSKKNRYNVSAFSIFDMT